MPNRNHNTISFEGDVKELRNALCVTEKEAMSRPKSVYTKTFYKPYEEGFFTNIIPCPPELKSFSSPANKQYGENTKMFEDRIKRHKKLYGESDRYNWCINNRGIKRDVSDIFIYEDTENLLEFNCETPRGPPIDGLINVSKIYPKLKIHISYDESGMGFSGEVDIQGGKIIKEILYGDGYYGEGVSCVKCGLTDHSESDYLTKTKEGYICEDCLSATL